MSEKENRWMDILQPIAYEGMNRGREKVKGEGGRRGRACGIFVASLTKPCRRVINPH